MNYKVAYLHLFNRITNITKLLKNMNLEIEQVALQEFERSLQTILDDGMANKNPEILAHWRAIPCKGGKPTPVEFMPYLVRNLEK